MTEFITDPYERRRLGLPYMPHNIQSRLIRERYRQPLIIDGQTFVPTVIAAKAIGRSTNYLLLPARAYRALNEIVIMSNGWRFYRLARHKGDQRGLMYWDVDSLKRDPQDA